MDNKNWKEIKVYTLYKYTYELEQKLTKKAKYLYPGACNWLDEQFFYSTIGILRTFYRKSLKTAGSTEATAPALTASGAERFRWLTPSSTTSIEFNGIWSGLWVRLSEENFPLCFSLVCSTLSLVASYEHHLWVLPTRFRR